jgi:hypothetical protein
VNTYVTNTLEQAAAAHPSKVWRAELRALALAPFNRKTIFDTAVGAAYAAGKLGNEKAAELCDTVCQILGVE